MPRFAFLLLFCLTAAAPASVAQFAYWEPADGPYGGTVAEDLLRNADGHLLAATHGGVFRSTDRGATWTDLSDGLAFRDVRALALAPDGTVYAGVYGDGVFYRTRGGGTWLPTTLRSTYTQALLVDDAGRLFAGTASGLLRSADGGASWEDVDPVPEASLRPGIRALAASAGYLYAATNQGLYRSGNAGGTWTLLGGGLADPNVTALAVNAAGHVFAGTSPIGHSGGVFRSRNHGALWTRLPTSPDPIQVTALDVAPDGTVYAGGFQYAYRSSDEGDRWQAFRVAETNVLAFGFTDDYVYLGTLGRGVFRNTPAGAAWQEANHGLRSTVYDLHLDDGRLYVGTAGGVFRSDDRGFTWTRLADGLTTLAVRSLAQDAAGRIVAGTYNGAFRLDPVALRWDAIGPAGTALRDLTRAPDGSLYAGYYAGVFRLAKSGTGGWTQLPLRGQDGADRDVIALAIDDAGTVYAGSYYDAFRFAGGTWTRLGPYDKQLFGVQDFTLGDGDLYAATRFLGVLRSSDRGATWTRLADGLSGLEDFQALAFDHRGRLYGGTFGGGVLRLNPTTEQWTDFSDGLTDRRVVALAFDAAGNGYAGTVGAGLFRHLGGGVVHTESETAAETMRLYPHTPNPVGAAATFAFTLPEAGPAVLDLFDVLGRRVARLADGTYAAGTHRVDFDAASLPAGVYVYRLSTARGTAVRTLVRVR